MSHKCAILGASGYTGAELIRLLSAHDNFKITALSGERKAGQDIAHIFPHLAHLKLPMIVRVDEIDFTDIALVFCALPHKTSQNIIANLPDKVKIIDLSADFRLRDISEYEKWYGVRHDAQRLQSEAIYGLSEFYRDEIRNARLVAGTGCNAAAGQYALRPVIEKGLIDLDNIIVDLKAGVSGAGRTLRENLLFAELSEGTMPYAIGGVHRHLGEFDQEFSNIAGRAVHIRFQPHLLPMNRGILVSAYVDGDAQDIYDCLYQRYEYEFFIKMMPFGCGVSSHNVRGSNFVHIGVANDRISGKAVIFCALDNLTKGSSGQAIQNANLMFGIEETAALMGAPLFP